MTPPGEGPLKPTGYAPGESGRMGYRRAVSLVCGETVGGDIEGKEREKKGREGMEGGL